MGTYCSRCISLKVSTSFQEDALWGIWLHTSVYFRSFHSDQIMPAAPVDANSRIEQSVKPHQGWSGLSLTQTPGQLSPLDCSADQQIQMDRCWLRPFKSSWPICTQRLPSTNMPASTHTDTLICCAYRCYIGPPSWSSTCSTSLP